MTKQTLIALLLSLLALSTLYYQETSKVDQFQNWKQQFGSPFNPEEEVYRRLIFEKNVEAIQRHNADPTQTYKMGINQFTIYSLEQFKARFLSEMIVPKQEIDIQYTVELSDEPNADIDWTTKSGVTSVKNQGSCGSCWAFAAVATSESWSLIKAKKTYDLSEQQLVDCSGSYGNKGCNGGWPSSAMKFIVEKGLVIETQYPYVAKQQTCKKTGGSYKINGIVTVAASCTALTTSIAVQPIAVTVDATKWSGYSSGVFSNCATAINHAVLLVGIVSGNWKIKNSWGANWGEKGYIRLASGNTCGLCLNKSAYPK